MNQPFDWVEVYASSDIMQMELIVNYLQFQHDLQVKFINKMDTMYLVGYGSLLVEKQNEQLAKDLIFIFLNPNYIT